MPALPAVLQQRDFRLMPLPIRFNCVFFSWASAEITLVSWSQLDYRSNVGANTVAQFSKVFGGN